METLQEKRENTGIKCWSPDQRKLAKNSVGLLSEVVEICRKVMPHHWGSAEWSQDARQVTPYDCNRTARAIEMNHQNPLLKVAHANTGWNKLWGHTWEEDGERWWGEMKKKIKPQRQVNTFLGLIFKYLSNFTVVSVSFSMNKQHWTVPKTVSICYELQRAHTQRHSYSSSLPCKYTWSSCRW